MNIFPNIFFAGFACADDIAVFTNEHERDTWVSGFDASTNTYDTVAAEERVALTIDDVRIAFMPFEGAPSADAQIAAAIKSAKPDAFGGCMRWITF